MTRRQVNIIFIMRRWSHNRMVYSDLQTGVRGNAEGGPKIRPLQFALIVPSCQIGDLKVV